MNKLLPLLAFSVLLLAPLGAQNAFAGPVPSVDLVKTASPTIISSGDTVTYTYTVTNDGIGFIFCGIVVDDKLGNISGTDVGNLSPKQQVQFVKSVDIFTATKNTATVVCNSDSGLISDTDMVTVITDLVGGEFLPIDSTALFLAYGIANAIWLAPTLAGLGAGIYLTKSKWKKN